MSVIHVNQIRNHIEKVFTGRLGISDTGAASETQQAVRPLGRGLAAYAIHHLAQVSLETAAESVTDDGDDNSIDAICYDEAGKRLFLVQSTWIRDGVGEPESGDVVRFVAGVRDLFNMKFDRFNAKVRTKRPLIELALNDPQTRYAVVIAHTGSSALAVHSRRHLDELEHEMNDMSEVVSTTVLNQAGLHASLTRAVSGDPINLAIALKSWGVLDAPHQAFYGQVPAARVAEWWAERGARLFAQNLRGVLGDTEVNREMRETLETTPDSFWYFNNGITVVARKASKSMAGVSDRDYTVFHCEDASVVNGAQTVAAIGKVGATNPTALESVTVALRIIVCGDDRVFAETVTRTNNRQNRVDARDFVALDHEQHRLQTELAIDGIEYQIMRSASFAPSDTSVDLVEATTALACASAKVRLVVQLKREIGKLWDNTSKAPYNELFNSGVSGAQLWRAVQVQRKIDRALASYAKRTKKDNYAVTTHGNRLVAALVFATLPRPSMEDPLSCVDESVSESAANALTDAVVEAVADQLRKAFPNSIIPTLFKNQQKCEAVFFGARAGLPLTWPT